MPGGKKDTTSIQLSEDKGFLPSQDIDALVKKGELLIRPYDPTINLQSASYDLRLDSRFLVPRDDGDVIDILAKEEYETVDTKGEPFLLRPNDFIIGSSVEYLRIPRYLAGILFARSSIGRRGIEIHPSAGWFDPCFEGRVVFEISSMRRKTILLRPGARIGQMAFVHLTRNTNKPYEGKYKGQDGPVGSLMHRDVDVDKVARKLATSRP